MESDPNGSSRAGKALRVLLREFEEQLPAADGAELLAPENVAPPFDHLLCHATHMTSTLADFYGTPVALKVLSERRSGGDYTRQILLHLQDDGPVVEFGIVKIRLNVLSEPVRASVLEGQRPLGDILIEHDVFRRIEPLWFFRFAPDSPVAAHFAPAARDAVVGRVGRIYCDEQPALELLEVVVDARERSS